MEALYTTKDIILRIIKRPGAYTGEFTLRSIEIYLWGYKMAIDMNKLKDIEPDFNNFHKFVANELGYSSSNAGWRRMIIATTLKLDSKMNNWSWEMLEKRECKMTFEEHKTSIELFFKLFDKFYSSLL